MSSAGMNAPGRLWSLLDMMNCHIYALTQLLTNLLAAESQFRQQATIADLVEKQHEARKQAEACGFPVGSVYVTDDEKRRINGLLQFADHISKSLNLSAPEHRVDMFGIRLHQPISYHDFASEIRALREAFEGEIKFEYFYHYPKQKALLVMRVQGDWKETLKAFPSTKKDIEDAVDCYACGHDTACGFHLMRVLEYGLRALAADVQKIYDKQNWHNIIDEISAAIEAERKTLPKGSARDERLTFLSVAAKEFFYFKDGWRNHTCHNRYVYDEQLAKSAIDHVCAF